MDPIYEVFLNEGVLGGVVIILILACVYLFKKCERLENEKFKLQQEHTNTLLKMKDEAIAVAREVTTSVQLLEDYRHDLRSMIRNLTAILKEE